MEVSQHFLMWKTSVKQKALLTNFKLHPQRDNNWHFAQVSAFSKHWLWKTLEESAQEKIKATSGKEVI